MRGLWVLSAVLVFIFNAKVLAQQNDLVLRTFSGTSKEATPVGAKKDIQDQAAQKVSEDIIKELIGEAKFLKNKSLIQNKVIKNSARYLPFMKPNELIQEGQEYKMSVSVKVSLKDIKQLLQAQSLLNENDTIPVVLPLISWIDRVQGRSYRWWLPIDKTQHGFLLKEGRLLEESLRGAFQRNNFYFIKPIDAGLGASVPLEFQTEKISTGEEAQFFAQFFNAPVLIDGQIVLNKGERENSYRIEIKMTALQVSNGRAIADVSRRYETDSGSLENVVDKKLREVLEPAANDLASQILEVWQRGSLGTSIIRLTVQGKSSIPAIEKYKEIIRLQVSQVKGIRERLISADSVSYELDTAFSELELITKLESLDFDGRKMQRVSEEPGKVILKWAQ